MDLATLSGILAGLGFVAGACLSGFFPFPFIDPFPILLIAAGTLASMLACSPLAEIRLAFAAVFRAFTSGGPYSDEAVAAMVKMAEISRREGLVAMEKVKAVNPLLLTASGLIASGADGAAISVAEKDEIMAMRERHGAGIMFFVRLASVAAGLGICGSLACLGFIVFNYADNPSLAGPAASVAVLSAFYGSLMAHLLFMPLANRLRLRRAKEEMSLQIVFSGVRLILENNNPRLVSEKLSSSFLPSKP